MEVEAHPSDGLVLRGIILCLLEVVILQTHTTYQIFHKLESIHFWSVSRKNAYKVLLASFFIELRLHLQFKDS